MGFLVQLELHIILQHGTVFFRHVGCQQLIDCLTDHMIDIQLRTHSRTHLQHARQTGEQSLQERVDGHHLHVVIIQQHFLEALPCPARQLGIRRLLVTHHEITRA